MFTNLLPLLFVTVDDTGGGAGAHTSQSFVGNVENALVGSITGDPISVTGFLLELFLPAWLKSGMFMLSKIVPPFLLLGL